MKKIILAGLFLLLFTGCSTDKKNSKQPTTSSTKETIAQSDITETTASSTLEADNYLVYDVEDSEIVEQMITSILKETNGTREQMNIRIYTADDYTQRTIWLAEAAFNKADTTYWLYIKKADKFISIQKNEFEGKRKGLENRNDSAVPIYEETNVE